jgi:hypothetical protein
MHGDSLLPQYARDDLRDKLVFIFLLEVDFLPFLAVRRIHPHEVVCRVVYKHFALSIHLNQIIVFNRLQLALVCSTCCTSAFALSTAFVITLGLFTILILLMLPHGLLFIECDLPLDPEHDFVLALDHHVLAEFEDEHPGLIDTVPLELQELYLALHVPPPLALHILRLIQQLLSRRHLVSINRMAPCSLSLGVLLEGTQELLENWGSIAGGTVLATVALAFACRT